LGQTVPTPTHPPEDPGPHLPVAVRTHEPPTTRWWWWCFGGGGCCCCCCRRRRRHPRHARKRGAQTQDGTPNRQHRKRHGMFRRSEESDSSLCIRAVLLYNTMQCDAIGVSVETCAPTVFSSTSGRLVLYRSIVSSHRNLLLSKHTVFDSYRAVVFVRLQLSPNAVCLVNVRKGHNCFVTIIPMRTRDTKQLFRLRRAFVSLFRCVSICVDSTGHPSIQHNSALNKKSSVVMILRLRFGRFLRCAT